MEAILQRIDDLIGMYEEFIYKIKVLNKAEGRVTTERRWATEQYEIIVSRLEVKRAYYDA